MADSPENLITTAKEAQQAFRKTHGDKIKGISTHVTSAVRDRSLGVTYVAHSGNVRRAARSRSVSDYSNEGKPSALQEHAPRAKPTLDRCPKTCAEHYAIHALLKAKREKGVPPEGWQNMEVATVRFNKKTGEGEPLERCPNCQAYKMGTVHTDPKVDVCSECDSCEAADVEDRPTDDFDVEVLSSP